MILSNRLKSAALPFALSLAFVSVQSLHTVALADHHETAKKEEGCNCSECDSCKDAKKCKDGKCKLRSSEHHHHKKDEAKNG
jgi:hypothetical protein